MVDIRLGEESREVKAENLVGRVTLDSLCAGIPRRHEALCIKQVDCMVAHAFNNGAELLVEPARFFKRRFLFRYVADEAYRHPA